MEQENKKDDIVLQDNEKIPDSFSEEVAIVRIWASTANPYQEGQYVGHVSLELILDGKRGCWTERTYISVGPDTTDFDRLMKKPFHLYNVKYVEDYVQDVKKSEERTPDFTFVFYSLDVVVMNEAVKKFLRRHPLDAQRWTVAGPSFDLGECKKSYWEVFSDKFSWNLRHFSSRSKGILSTTDINENEIVPNCIDDGNIDEPINVSCVSLAFDILNKGKLSTTLLTVKDKQKVLLFASDESSNESISGILHAEYLKVLKAAGYILEHGLSKLIMSPDVFVDLLMAAKQNEMKVIGPPKHVLNFVVKSDSNKQMSCTECVPSLKKKSVPYVISSAIIVAVAGIASATYSFWA